VIAPVLLQGATSRLESEFDTSITRRFEYLWFAQDDEKNESGEVVPGIGGSVYELLGIGNSITKNSFVPEIVKFRRRTLKSGGRALNALPQGSYNEFGNFAFSGPQNMFGCFKTGQTLRASKDDVGSLLVGAGLNTATFRISQISENGTTFLTIPPGGTETLILPNGTLVVHSDGSYTYTASVNPTNPQPGPADAFLYKIVNTMSGSESAARDGRLPAVALPLIVNDNTFAADASGEANGNVLITDYDPGGEPLTVRMINTTPVSASPTTITLANGVLNINPDGTFVFRFMNSVAIQTFTYMVTNTYGCTGSATVTINRRGSLSGGD
jgi:hypothetical protein